MPQKNNFNKTFYVLSVAWQLGFFIVIPVGGFLFLGHLGDKFFKTSPLLLIIGSLIGIITAVYGVYSLLSPLIKVTRNKKKDD